MHYLFCCRSFGIIILCILSFIGIFLHQRKPFNKRFFVAPYSLLKSYLREKPLQNSIIIYAKGRTGSTFTGEFFDHHNSVFYMFEPLQYVYFDNIFTNGVAILKKFLTCQFNPLRVEGILGDRAKWWRNRFCCGANSSYCSEFNISIIQKECYMSQFTATKEVSIRKIEYLSPLVDQGSRVIMLVRDPRGFICSSLINELRYPTSGGYEFDGASSYCHVILRDLDYIRSRRYCRKSYHIVRYEDLAVDPITGAQQLYDYIGIPPDESLLNWAAGVKRGHTNADDGPMGTTRDNSTETAQRWRQVLQLEIVLQIQEACDTFMDIFGYTKVYTQNELFNNNRFLTDPRDLGQLIC